MPPQNSFTIKQNTPEADKLERRVHAELKEIWDPSADATVAKYLTAMLTKGYDRKKIHSQLKAILQEPVTVQLLDWLYKHLRLHGSEYQSKENPASSKQAPKPLPSVAKVVPMEEVELRLEDLEAQQLEGSDLEDDDTAAAPASIAEESAGRGTRFDAVQSHEHDRGDTGRDGSSEPAGQAAQVTHAGKVTGVDAQLSEKPERSRRRQREPIPIPNFSERPERPRSRASDTIPSPGQPLGTHRISTAGASSQAAATPGELRHPSETQLPKQQQRQVEEQQQAKEQQEQFSAAAERRRLKSSVVLDWESWQKQKQPADEQRATKSSAPAGNLAAPERAPIMPHSNQDTADHPLRIPASHRGREDGRERERDRGREREGERGGGPGRRRHESEAERPASRHRDGDGDTSALRGHERESDGVRQKGGAPAHRSRSRSRSRSPRGRRPGHAPLVTANLLRSALGGLGGPGARGSKASVFERLGASGAAPEAAPARVSALQRLEGSDKVDRAMDTSGSGRKRGPEGEADADAAILGSPPKTARGINAQKPSGPLRAAAEPPPAPALRAGPASGRPRVEFAPATAPVGVTKQPAGPPKQDPVKVTSASDQATIEGGPSSKQTAAAAAPVSGTAGPVDTQAAELEALRKQMAAMQEKLARMEAARDVSPPPQPQLQPQPQAQGQPQPPQQPQQQPHPQAQLHSQPQQQPFQLQPNLRLQPQQQQSLVRPQSLPASQPEPAIAQQQQQGIQPQQIPMATRPQPQHVSVPSATTVGIRPVAGVSVAGGVKGPGAGGTGAATIMPTSMSGVVIEGGSGSPPRKPVIQQSVPPTKPDPQRLAAAQLDADLRSVVVTNVHFLASQEVLAAHFSVVGPVKNVTIMRDKVTGRPTGVAVVEMATEQATQAAAALSGSLLMDLPIVVTLKAALLLQGINLAGMGIDSAGVRMPVLMPPLGSAANIAPAGRLNPSAVPFVPGLPASAPAPADARLAGGPSGAVGGIPVRPPLGAPASAGRQSWPKLGAGGRGRGSNVWLREGARPGNAIGPSTAERS